MKLCESDLAVAARARAAETGEFQQLEAFEYRRKQVLAVVNADLAHIPSGEICQVEVIQTWVRGQVVYSRE